MEPTKLVKKQNTEVGIATFLDQRKQFIDQIQPLLLENADYYIIRDRKSLAKGGAEKIATIFGWTAQFDKDTPTIEMLGSVPGLVAYVCNLTKDGKIVGQGRGASTLGKNAGDANKTIKMSQKSAFIDAVIRTSGLSDIFTQDLDTMFPEEIKAHPAEINPSPGQAETPSGGVTNDQLKRMMTLAEEKKIPNITVTSYIKLAYHKDSARALTEEEGNHLIKYLEEFDLKREEALDGFTTK